MASIARSASFAGAPTRMADGVGRPRTAGGSRVGPRRASAAAAERDPPSAPVSESLSRARRALLWRAEDAAAAKRPLDVYTELLVAAAREDVLAGASGAERASSEDASANENNADGFSGAELSAALDHLAFDALQEIMEQFEVSRGIEVMGTMRQVVVVGSPGFDSRAFRVPWPRGTCVFEFGGADAHAAAAATFKAAGAKPPRGCSHRRDRGLPGAGRGGRGALDRARRSGAATRPRALAGRAGAARACPAVGVAAATTARQAPRTCWP